MMEKLQRIEDSADAAETHSDDHMMVIDARDVLLLCEVARNAHALYEQVEMSESVGICLSERVASLNLFNSLTKLDR